MRITDFPVIKFTLIFITGIYLREYLELSIEMNIILLGTFALIFPLVFLAEKRKSSFFFTSLIVCLFALLTGFTSANIEINERTSIPDSIYAVKNFTACGKIENIGLPDQDGVSFLLKTDSIKAVRKIHACVNILCRVSGVKGSGLFDSLYPGNSVMVSGTYRKGREQRNIGEFDYNKYLRSKNISGTLLIYDRKDISTLSHSVDHFGNLVLSARKGLYRIITKLHNPSTAALLKGLILADRSDIDYDTKTQFINAGVVHVLAVSGLHVGFIALVFYALLGRLNLYLRSFLTISGVLLFMLLTGVAPSVFRASVMTVVIITAFLLNRSTNIYNSLAIAAFLILLLNPSELFNPGFQLSFASVLSIAYFYPVLKRIINKIAANNKTIKNLLLFIAVSISVQIGTLPLILYYTGKLSLISLISNIIVIPLTGIIIGTSLAALALFPFSLLAAAIYASAGNFFSHLLFQIVEFAGTFQYAFIEIRNYTPSNALIFYLLIFMGMFLSRHMHTVKAELIFVLLIMGSIALWSVPSDRNMLAENKLSVYMIDVGQGDSFLIRFPDGETALVDAGETTPFYDNGESVILPLLNRLGIKIIDYAFISHIDADHYGGFFSLIEEGRVKKIYKPRADSSSTKDIRFETYLRHKNICTAYYRKAILKIGNTEIFILTDSTYAGTGLFSSNNKSGVLKLTYGRTSFLFTGDLEVQGEKYYLNKYKDFLKADVLKVGHHGSKSGSSSYFLNRTAPGIGLISCGIKNKFGHPSAEVIRRLTETGCEVFRTDREGGILLQSDGISVSKVDWRNYY